MFFTGKGDLKIYGPTIQVTILPSTVEVEQLRKNGLTIPTLQIIALIDTGASCCSISTEVAKKLSLVSFEKETIYTPSGASEHLLFDIGLILPVFPNKAIPIQVFAVNLEKQPISMLIGRDILSICTLFYNGSDNSFTLHG